MIDLTPWLRCADGDRSRGRRSRGRSASRRRSRRRSMCWTAPWITCRAWRGRPWTWRHRPPCPTPEVRYLVDWLVAWLDCRLRVGPWFGFIVAGDFLDSVLSCFLREEEDE